MPESGRTDAAGWHVAGWPLRTKVAVVLVVPAVVALVLGGLRVQGDLDNANRLSTVRDQLAVLTESIALSELVAEEMVSAASADDDELADSVQQVDEQVAAVRDATDFAGLPDTVDSELRDALARLDTLRTQQDEDAVTTTAGYQEVLASLADLTPDVVSLAGNDDLDDQAASVRSLALLRATLGAETALIRSGLDGPDRAAVIAAAQEAATEEVVLVGQLAADLPESDADSFADATGTATERRAALQAAVAGERVAALPNLLPGLDTASVKLKTLLDSVFSDLSASVATQTNDARSDALRDSAVVLGALLAALAIALTVARSLLSPLHRLRAAALHAANEQLPRTVERVRTGEQVDYQSVEPVPVHTEEEIGQLARAFDDMHRQAVRLAGEQAELRLQVSEMFMTLSRRSQSLVELQLGVIEELEADEQDPQRLAGLFRLDHLATRLRRNGENLQVLAGGTPPRRGNRPVSVVELLRAATSEITDYKRVTLGNAPTGSVRASGAADLVHILAELLENATRFSPPDRKVVLTADRGSRGGLLFEVVDGGIGMAPEDLATANERLATTDAVGPETTRRMGLFVVSQLAARHGITVRLRPTYESANQAGVTASIYVPGTLVIADTTPPVGPPPGARAILPATQPAMASVGSSFELPAVPPPQPELNGHTQDWFTPLVEPDAPAWPAEVDHPPETRPPAPVTRAPAVPPAQVPPAPAPRAAVADEPDVSAPVGTTAAGLPMRKPGGHAMPERRAERTESRQVDFRDPETIRSNLSRHYSGMQAARHARQEPDSTPSTERNG